MDRNHVEALEPVTVEIGSSQPVVIDKLYGPTDFAALRITADTMRGWVVERQWGDTGAFVEWVTIPGQLDAEFPPESRPSGEATTAAEQGSEPNG